MKKITQITAFFAALLFATGASAGAVSFGNAQLLQDVLDGITTLPVAGDSSVDVTTDEVGAVEGMDEYWAIGGTGGSVSTIIVEIAGAANVNIFGIYDAANPSNMVTIFDGPDSAGLFNGGQATVSILADGSVAIGATDTGVDFAGNNFGFFLDSSAWNGGGLFYSDTSLNADLFDHMAAYQGQGDTVQVADFAAGVWGSNEYILAWEDLYGGGDGDFRDFVVFVESVNPVPAPGTLVLLGLALAGLGARRRKA